MEGRQLTIHIIRDLTALPKKDRLNRYVDKEHLLTLFCKTLLEPNPDKVFIIAANDGQLIEHWHHLQATEEVNKIRQLIELLLVEDLREVERIPLKFFNLSRVPSADLFDLVLNAVISHESWRECYLQASGETELFGLRCPIRGISSCFRPHW